MTEVPAPGSFLDQYLEELAGDLADRAVSELAINPDGQVWLDRPGAPWMVPAQRPLMRAAVESLANTIAGTVGSQLGAQKPLVSGRISWRGEAIRAQVIGRPAVEGGPAVSLRRYRAERHGIGDFSVLTGSLRTGGDDRAKALAALKDHIAGDDLGAAMAVAVGGRLNILVSGGTNSGKTTFARALLDLVASEERLVTIEDAFELFPTQRNVVALRAVRSDEGELTPAKLLEATLRLRPDRIVLGELRGAEAVTFLEALNTGHEGSVSTVHANSAELAIDRLALMVLRTGLNMSFDEVRRYCRSSVDVIVQMRKAADDGRRGVSGIYMPGANL